MMSRALTVVAAALLAAGCGGPRAYVREGFLEQPPRRVAVLPFVITYAYDVTPEEGIPESHRAGRDLFRKTFYHGLSTHGFEDVRLAEVDERLAARWGALEGGAWRAAGPQELGEVVGADGLLYGDVHRIMHFTTPMYTETSLVATLRLVEASSGEDLWRQRVSVAERGGVLLQKGQVVDFLKDQVRSWRPEIKYLRVADLAVRRALATLPNPPMPASTAGGPAPTSAARAVRTNAAPRLAILPFAAARTTWAPGAAALRRDVAASLQDGLFEVLELQRIDATLQELGWEQISAASEGLDAAELGKTLGADVLLRGTVKRWGRSYWVAQSWVTAQLQLELVDAASGVTIWSDVQKNSRTAGILKGPTGYTSLATSALKGLKQSHLERVGTHLARRMAEDLAVAPGVLAYVDEAPRAARPADDESRGELEPPAP